MSAACRSPPRRTRARQMRKRGRTMTDRRIEEPRKTGPDAALVIVAALAVLAGARWLARLGRPALAAIAAAVVVVVFVVWAVRPGRQLPRHRVRVMRLR